MEKILRSKSWRPSQGPGASIHVSSYRIPESAESITILVLTVGQRIFINDMSSPWCKGESKQIKHATNIKKTTLIMRCLASLASQFMSLMKS